MKNVLVTTLTAAAILISPKVTAQDHKGHDHTGHDHTGHDHAGHNHAAEAKETKNIVKRTLSIKGVALIEFVQNQTDGVVTISVMDEKKVALVPEIAPRLNLIVDGKHKQLKSVAVESETAKFSFKDDALKAALNGKVALKVAGKTHQVAIDPHFGHNHGPGAHHH